LQVENGSRGQKAVNEEQSVWIRVDAKEAEDENDDDDWKTLRLCPSLQINSLNTGKKVRHWSAACSIRRKSKRAGPA
jgi:hypothetical protein